MTRLILTAHWIVILTQVNFSQTDQLLILLALSLKQLTTVQQMY